MIHFVNDEYCNIMKDTVQLEQHKCVYRYRNTIILGTSTLYVY